MKTFILLLSFIGFFGYIIYGSWPIKPKGSSVDRIYAYQKRRECAEMILITTVVIALIMMFFFG